MPQHNKQKKKRSKKALEKKIRTEVGFEVASRKRTGKGRKKSSPGIKARARNLARTGQAVPVKGEKRSPAQKALDKAKKRLANP